MTDAESAAKLAIYLLLLPVALYCFWRHGKTGFLGWLYISAFCVLRIVTGAIGVHGSATGTASVVLTSVGLSPLLLGIAGFHYEMRRAMNPKLNRVRELLFEMQLHAIVAIGIILSTVALVRYMTAKTVHISTVKILLDVGSALSALSWVILTLWAVYCVQSQKRTSVATAPCLQAGKTLRIGVFIALGLVALRLGYSLAFLQLRISHPKSSFLRSKAAEICLSMVPEILIVLTFLCVGYKTRGLSADLKKQDDEVRPKKSNAVETK